MGLTELIRQRNQSAPTDGAVDFLQQTDTTATDTTGSTQPLDLEARYGLSPYGNQYGFKTLNKMIDEDGLDSQQRYEVQQKWFANQEKFIQTLPQHERGEWQKVLNEIKNDRSATKEYSFTTDVSEKDKIGGTKDDFNDDRFYTGLKHKGTNLVHHLAGNVDNELGKRHPELVAKYQEVQKLRSDAMASRGVGVENDGFAVYAHQPSIDAYMKERMPDYGNVERMYRHEQAKLEEELIADEVYNRLYEFEDHDGKKQKMPYREAIAYLEKTKTKFASDDAYKKAREEGDFGADVGFLQSIGRSMANNWETTQQMDGELVAAGIASVIRLPVVSDVLSSSVNVIMDMHDKIDSTVAEKYREETGGDVSQLSSRDYLALMKRYAKEGVITEARYKGLVKGFAHAATEAVVSAAGDKFVGNVSAKAKSKLSKAFILTAGGLTSEIAEELVGDDVATAVENVLDGKDVMDGLGENLKQRALDTVFSAETAVGTANTAIRATSGASDADTTKDGTSQVEVTTNQTQTPPPSNTQVENTITEQPGVVEDGVEMEQVKQRIRDLNDQLQRPELTEADREAIAKELNSIDEQHPDYSQMGIVFDTLNNPGQGTSNEDRNSNSDGGENANGSLEEQRADVADNSGTQRSSETVQQVPPTETETTTEGYNQPNTPPITDTVGQPVDNSTESSAVGSDGRTGETDGRGVEQGELGQSGGEQVEAPTETTQLGSTGSGVQQRTESDSERKTLTTFAETALAKGVISSQSTYEERPKQRTTDTDFEFFSGGASTGPVAWGTMSSNLAYGYARKRPSKDQAITVYKPKQGQEINYVVFDGEGRDFKSLAKKLNTVSLPVKEFGNKNSDKVVATLALENKYDAVIIRNYKDLGGITPNKGAMDLDRSDTVVVLNKDKFITQTGKATEFNAYSNGFTLDTTGLPTVTEDDLLVMNKQQRERYKRNETNTDSDVGVQSDKRTPTDTEQPETNVKSKRTKSPKQDNSDKRERSVSDGDKKVTKPNKFDQKVERENTKRRAIDAAVASTVDPKTDYANLPEVQHPFAKIADETIKRFNQKGVEGQINDFTAEAHTIYVERTANLDTFDDAEQFDKIAKELAEAMFPHAVRAGVVKNGKDTARPSQWYHAIKTGQKKSQMASKIKYTAEQQERIRKARAAATEERLDELQHEHTTEAQTAVVLATQPETANEVAKVSAKTFFKDPENRAVEQEMREAVEEFAEEKNFIEDDGTAIQGTDENLAWAANRRDFLDWVGDRLRPFFKKFNNLVAGVIAFVAVGAMTVPTDAYAQQPFSTYTQGQKVEGVSQEASNTINWVQQRNDHNGKNYVVADKDQGKIHVVSPDGKVLHTQNALFGKGQGNDKSAMNTPSGRMMLQKETKLNATEKGIYGDSVLDFVHPTTKAKVRQDDGGIVAMHRVLNKVERKAALNSATPNDNYISHGCINLPTAFYNSSVDNLDGAMVYVLDHKEPKKATTKNTKSTTNYSKPTTKANVGTGYKPKQLFSVNTLDNFDGVNTGLTKNTLASTLEKALGKDIAETVNIISKEEFNKHEGFIKLQSQGIEGFYDPNTDNIYLVADNLHPARGLSAELRAAWVAFHEFTHRGLLTELGTDLNNILDAAYRNDTVRAIADVILKERVSKGLLGENDVRTATEEALSELNAARQTGKWGELKDRYGVDVSADFGAKKGFFDTLMSRLRNIIKSILGRATLSDQQVTQLLRDVSYTGKPMTPASAQLTADMLDKLNDPSGAYQSTVRNSVTKTAAAWVAKTTRGAKNTYNKMTGQKVLSNSQGQVPINRETGQIAYDEKMDQEALVDQFSEAFIDSEHAVVQAIGGVMSNANIVFKMAKNAINQTITLFNKGISSWQDRVLDTAFKLRDQSNGKFYKGKEGVQAIYQDIQDVAVSIYGITGGNAEVRQKLVDDIASMQGDFDNFQEGVTALGQAATNYQREQLAKLGRALEENKTKLKIYDERINLIVGGKTVKGKYTPHPDSANLPVMDVIVGDKVVGKTTSREGMGFLGGQTIAESYDALTRLVNDGVINVIVKGKPWADYIKDVGFSRDKGFADKSKDYTLDPADIEIKDGLADVTKEYVQLTKEHRDYMNKHGQGSLAANLSSNPWAVPTSGEVDVIRSHPVVNEDGSVSYMASDAKTIEDAVRLDEAAQWDKGRSGRAFTSASALSQLSYTSSLAAKQVGMQEFAKEMEKIHKQEPKKVRRIAVSSPYFTKVDGIIQTKTDPDTGKTTYYKLSFADQKINDAMFGKNRFSWGDKALTRGTVDLLGTFSQWKSLMLTSSMGFSVASSYRGLQEKNRFLIGALEGSELDNDPNFAQVKALIKGLTVEGDITLQKRSLTYLFKYFPLGLPAAIAFARYLASSNPNVDKYRNGRGVRKDVFDKLVQLHAIGGITHRADMINSQAQDLVKTMPSTKLGKKFKNYSTSIKHNLLVMTSAMEFISSLAFVDTLMSFGVGYKQAAGVNLLSINFNDSGASAVSAYTRAFNPFSNSAAQGAKSTAMSVSSKAGAKNFALGVMVKAPIAYSLLSLLSDIADCDTYEGRNIFDNINSYEAVREYPVQLGCQVIRFPVAYGAKMIEWAIGFGAMQVIHDRWSKEQAFEHIWDTMVENLAVVPPGTMKGTPMHNLQDFLLPDTFAKLLRVNAGFNDFYNNLLAYGATSSDPYNYMNHKSNVDPDWAKVAEMFPSLNWNGNQWEEASKIFLDGWLRDLAAWAWKTGRGDEKGTALTDLSMAVLGGKAVYRPELKKQEYALRRIHNATEKHKDLYDEVYKAMKFNIDHDGDGEGDGKLSLGTKKREAIVGRMNWIAETAERLNLDSEREAVLEAIVEHAVAMTKAKKLDKESKEEAYTEANMEFLHELDRIEGKRK